MLNEFIAFTAMEHNFFLSSSVSHYRISLVEKIDFLERKRS